jgi:ABC-type transport system involved in multi-copper enzyme maturation permease subunit
MKALIRKELRENLKVTLVGLAVLLLFILLKYRDYAWSLKNHFFTQEIQPLMSDGVISVLTFFCAIFGGVLGWLQIWNERHRDLWAFLIHRPLTRTQIFFSKTFAGLLLYLLMPGLPLLGCILWVAIPGHVPAPFEWSMVLPIAAAFLGGILYYFAGMLTGLRQARWYASRCLGVLMALLVSIQVMSSFEFWHALIFIVAGAVILGTAMWGAFRSEGYYEGQPVSGKAALTTVLGAGLALVVFIVTLLTIEVVFRGTLREEWSRYVMTKGGAIYKVTSKNDGSSSFWKPVVDLDHEQFREGKTGRLEKETLRGESLTGSIHLPSPYGGRQWPSFFMRSYRFFTFWGNNPGTIWYYWRSYGCLVGYDKTTLRFIGSLGPNGFSQAFPSAADKPDRPVELGLLAAGRTLATSNAVFEADTGHRVTRRIFTSDDERILAVRDYYRNESEWIGTLIVTEHSIVLVDPKGAPVWRQPFQPFQGFEDQLKVSALEPAGQYAIWVSERARTNAPAGGSAAMLVTWFGYGQSASPNVELPPLRPEHERPGLVNKLLSASLPPVFVAAMPLLDGNPWPSAIPKELLRISLIAALVCVPLVWWLGQRYRFSLGARLSWAGFIVLTGVPGLLAFMSVQEWPAREACPKCGKLRVVDREQCEHCGASFPPPEKTGTEIFEPVGTGQG